MRVQVSLEILTGIVLVVLFVLFSLVIVVNLASYASSETKALSEYASAAGSYAKQMWQSCGCAIIR